MGKFFAGSWQDMRDECAAGHITYDVILAAETIYKTDSYGDLAALLETCLAPAGAAWFSGKRYYFGCGGGTTSFSAFLRDRGFEVEVCRNFEDGRSNVRDILKVTRGCKSSEMLPEGSEQGDPVKR